MHRVRSIAEQYDAVGVPALTGDVPDAVEERLVVGPVEERREFPADGFRVVAERLAGRPGHRWVVTCGEIESNAVIDACHESLASGAPDADHVRSDLDVLAGPQRPDVRIVFADGPVGEALLADSGMDTVRTNDNSECLCRAVVDVTSTPSRVSSIRTGSVPIRSHASGIRSRRAACSSAR